MELPPRDRWNPRRHPDNPEARRFTIPSWKKTPGIKQLDHQPANYDLAPALPIVEDWKTRFNGQFKVIYSHNDPIILGAHPGAEGHQSATRTVFMIGIDGQREAFQAIKEGWLQATAIYPTGGAEGVRVALKLLKGEQVPRRVVAECPSSPRRMSISITIPSC